MARTKARAKAPAYVPTEEEVRVKKEQERRLRMAWKKLDDLYSYRSAKCSAAPGPYFVDSDGRSIVNASVHRVSEATLSYLCLLHEHTDVIGQYLDDQLVDAKEAEKNTERCIEVAVEDLEARHRDELRDVKRVERRAGYDAEYNAIGTMHSRLLTRMLALLGEGYFERADFKEAMVEALSTIRSDMMDAMDERREKEEAERDNAAK